MRWTPTCFALTFLLSPAVASAYTYEQQSACMGDAFRLCSQFIPDEGAITNCMAVKRRQLSRQCRMVFDASRSQRRRPAHEGAYPYPTPTYTPYGGGYGYQAPGGYDNHPNY